MEVLQPIIDLVIGDVTSALLFGALVYLYRQNTAKDKLIEKLQDREREHLEKQLTLFQSVAMKAGE